jgi:hypothetical protein
LYDSTIYIYMKFIFKGIKFSIRFYSQRGSLVPLRCFTHPKNFPRSLSRNWRSIRTQVDKSETQAQFTGKHSQPLLIPKQRIHKTSCVRHAQFCLQAHLISSLLSQENMEITCKTVTPRQIYTTKQFGQTVTIEKLPQTALIVTSLGLPPHRPSSQSIEPSLPT